MQNVLAPPRLRTVYAVWIGLAVVGFLAAIVGVARFAAPPENPELAAARLGADYLARHIHADGSFDYEFDPVNNRYSSSYNILRHAGAVYSLVEAYAVFQEPEYKEAAESGITYLLAQSVPCPGRGESLCILENDEIKLGGNALAALALVEYQKVTGNTAYQDEAALLAEYMLSTQAESGEFLRHKIDGDGADSGFVSEYYPGEALFALAKLHELTGEERWLAAAQAGARWLITVRDNGRSVTELPHDHWLLYALDAIDGAAADPLYVGHAKRLVDAIVPAQHWGLTGEEARWNGGYYDPPRSTPTATRNEGLIAATRLLRRHGEAEYANRALQTAKRGLDFCRQTQLTRKGAAQAGAARDAVGGFHEGLDDYGIRIDYVQHNISAYLGYHALITEVNR